MENQAIKKLHIIYKTHLDIGFTDLSAKVFETYEKQFLPKAIETARALNTDGQTRFIWTVGSFLIDRCLECADGEARSELEEAIRHGWIHWHALPFTTHTELMDESLFRFGLSLSENLDKRFGVRTTAAKMSDVPGHTVGIVPLLAGAGVRFFHVGINGSSKVPGVPQVFRWKCGESEILVNYAKSYGESTAVEGLDEAMVFMHSSDNAGPPTAEEVVRFLDQMRQRYPQAEISASTLDSFGDVLWSRREQFPVVTEEIGDTWIHGAATDPRKVSRFRSLLELRRRWEAEMPAGYAAARSAFSKSLLLVPEHTWGMDSKKYLYDFTNWSKEDFSAARKRDAIPEEALLPAPQEVQETVRREAQRFAGGLNGSYRLFERSHEEQRQYLRDAVEALPAALRDEAGTAFSVAESPVSSPEDCRPLAPGESAVISGHSCVLNEDGSLTLPGGTVLGVFRYETYNADVTDLCYRQYNRDIPATFGWSYPDFAKPGLSRYPCETKTWTPTVEKAGSFGGALFVRLNMEAPACGVYGCPRRLLLRYEEQKDGLHAKLLWGEKDAVRSPEALWFGLLPPKGLSMGDVKMKKLGTWLSPLSVVPGGNHSLHAVEELRLGGFRLFSPDTPVMSLGGRRLYDVSDDRGAAAEGFWLLPWNNRWGTNFRLWYEEDGHAELIFTQA